MQQPAKKIIWSLFDSENATVSELVKNDIKLSAQYLVYSFGKGNGLNHVHLDLSNFGYAKRRLDKYPKPDYIFASPPCETWCQVNVGTKRYYTSEKVLNFYYKNKWQRNIYLNQEQTERAMNGEVTAKTTAKIIEHYKPQCWAIENGTRSHIFAYLQEIANLQGYKNLTNYYSYGFNYPKPTTIYSNLMLNLKRKSYIKDINLLDKLENHIPNTDRKERAILRSKVPEQLYIDILKEFNIGGQKPLFQFLK
jgi:hypothetical protein